MQIASISLTQAVELINAGGWIMTDQSNVAADTGVAGAITNMVKVKGDSDDYQLIDARHKKSRPISGSRTMITHCVNSDKSETLELIVDMKIPRQVQNPLTGGKTTKFFNVELVIHLNKSA